VKRALCALLLIATAGVASAAEPLPSTSAAQAATLVRRVGAVFAEESRGVIAFRSHAIVRTSPHFVRPDQIDDAWIVDLDGRAVHVRSGDATGPAVRCALRR
jgi:hypothetical protein